MGRSIGNDENISRVGGRKMVQLIGYSHGGTGLGTRHQGSTNLGMLATLRVRYDKEATG